MMNHAQFEQEAASVFPATAEGLSDEAGLLHVQMGTLYRYTQEKIRSGDWQEVDKVFRFLEKALAEFESFAEIENAISVSYLEYFDFGPHETQTRRLLGSKLAQLHDDHMQYMRDLADRAAQDPGR